MATPAEWHAWYEQIETLTWQRFMQNTSVNFECEYQRYTDRKRWYAVGGSGELHTYLKNKFADTYDGIRNAVLHESMLAKVSQIRKEGPDNYKTFADAIAQIEQEYAKSPYSEILLPILKVSKDIIAKEQARRQAARKAVIPPFVPAPTKRRTRKRR